MLDLEEQGRGQQASFAEAEPDAGSPTAPRPAGRPTLIGGIWQRWRTSPSGRVGLDVLNHFNDDDGWAMASHVALTTLMSIFPFLIFVAALAGFIGDIKLADILTDFLFSSWPRTIADPIVSEVHRAVANATGGLITGSALVAFCLASAGVGAVRSALNRAYRAAEQRAFLLLQLQNLLFVILGAAGGAGTGVPACPRTVAPIRGDAVGAATDRTAGVVYILEVCDHRKSGRDHTGGCPRSIALYEAPLNDGCGRASV